MLYACVVGDNTVTEMEKALHNVVMQEVLSEPPADMQFVNPAKNRERIPIDKLRKMKITSTLLNADFNAVDPKVVNREDRFWYVVPERPSGHDGKYRQESAEKMVMCYLCSQDKRDGKRYDTNELYAGTCPNCAANLCREYYFMKHDPEEADVALRWAASTLLQEQKDNPAWGLMQPADNIREWMWKTIEPIHLEFGSMCLIMEQRECYSRMPRTSCSWDRENRSLSTGINNSTRVAPFVTTFSFPMIMATECTQTT